jgi:cbb3-type cytochrome oxidase cytochrome c subunit
MRGGPDLTGVGRPPEHTADWLSAHIRDPKAHNPASRMPAFGPDKLPDADLKALAAYLASRK